MLFKSTLQNGGAIIGPLIHAHDGILGLSRERFLSKESNEQKGHGIVGPMAAEGHL